MAEKEYLYEKTIEAVNELKQHLNIGFVGYCPPTKYDEGKAEKLIKEAFDKVQVDFPNCLNYNLISGVTNVGTLKQAYKEADNRGWNLYGVACTKAKEYEWYPGLEKDNVELVGENWGDESKAFTAILDAIVRVGGGSQSLRECDAVKQDGKPTYEYELEVVSEIEFS